MSDDHAVEFVVPGEPASKARARFTAYRGKARTYTPEATRTAELAIAARYRKAAGPRVVDDTHQFRVEAVFVNGTRQRRDVDNMLKLVLDGLNKVAWQDDVQVSEVTGSKVWSDHGDSRTEVRITKLGLIPLRTATCVKCGVAYRTYPSWTSKRFCSDDCRLEDRRAQRQRTVPEWVPGSAGGVGAD